MNILPSALPDSATSLVNARRPEQLPEAANHPEIAQQFEAMFYSLLLKTMRNSMTENGLFGKESSDTLGGMFDMFMGQHLASSQSLGIARMMETYLANSSGTDKESH